MELTAGAERIPLSADADGKYRVGGTRVSLESVAYAVENGDSPEQIVQSFPTLTLADVYLVVGYILRHREEVEAYLRERERLADEAREKYPMDPGIRERLLARRREQESAR